MYIPLLFSQVFNPFSKSMLIPTQSTGQKEARRASHQKSGPRGAPDF